MKSDINFMDALNFILSENNFNTEFFIIYDKKLKKVMPYIYTDENQNENNKNPKSLYFQISSINLKDKNKYYLLHSSELPAQFFNKELFIRHTIHMVTNQCLERNKNSRELGLNLTMLLKELQKVFNLTEEHMKDIYESSEILDSYSYETIMKGKYVLFPNDSQGDRDSIEQYIIELKDKIEDNMILLARYDSNVDTNVRRSMINELNKNKDFIENKINQNLNNLLTIIEPKNKLKDKLKV